MRFEAALLVMSLGPPWCCVVLWVLLTEELLSVSVVVITSGGIGFLPGPFGVTGSASIMEPRLWSGTS